MTTEETKQLYDKYIINNYYGRVPTAIVKGQGNYIYDAEGNEFLDMFPGWATGWLGHCHPNVVKAIQSQAQTLLHIDNTMYIPQQAKLAELISQKGFGGKCFFCNSGAEAVEAALKLARLHTVPEKYKFITAEGSFHGRTFAAMTATAQPQKNEQFQPLMPGFNYVPFNDIDALQKAFDDEVCAVMVEPIQGEGGINPATPEYLRAIRDLCDKNNAVMILDEVQTGLGRTGKWFGYQNYDIVPDIITMAKSLGSGVPIAAIMATQEVAEAMKPGTHASTYGGNPLVCAAAIAVIETIENQNLLDHAGKLSEYIIDKLNQLKQKHSIIDHIRGIGLMIGIQLNAPGADIVSKCWEKGMRINCTQSTVLRFMPSIITTEQQIDQAINILDNVLTEIE